MFSDIIAESKCISLITVLLNYGYIVKFFLTQVISEKSHLFSLTHYTYSITRPRPFVKSFLHYLYISTVFCIKLIATEVAGITLPNMTALSFQ